MIINNKVRAFSIAEALTTMLIVSLVILMVIPVFTRKGRKGVPPKGYWECRIDESGNHYAQSSTSETLEAEPNGLFCVFKPPTYGKNFTVNIVGGGGGGAAASIETDQVSANSAQTSFVPLFSAPYNVVIIGGGGGAGGKSCGDGASQGGGAGQVIVAKDVNLVAGATYTLVPGAGGDGGPYHGHENSEEMKGKSSYFLSYNGSANYTAEGGNGGYGKHGAGSLSLSCDRWGSDGKSPGGYYYMNGVGGGGNAGGSTCRTSDGSCYPGLEDILGETAFTNYGKGGNGRNGHGAGESGRSGFVFAEFSGLYAGGGGKSGTHVFKAYKKLQTPVKVRIGDGGAGGTSENASGQPGTSSAFGSIVAGGGMGGKNHGKVGYGDGLAGVDGIASPYGDKLSGGGTSAGNINGTNNMDVNHGFSVPSETLYGAGGGGGGARAKKFCNIDDGYKGCWGKGGRGASGYVRVEWN